MISPSSSKLLSQKDQPPDAFLWDWPEGDHIEQDIDAPMRLRSKQNSGSDKDQLKELKTHVGSVGSLASKSTVQINWFLCSRELSYRETVITLASPHVADSGAIILSLLVASPLFWLSPHAYCENHQLSGKSRCLWACWLNPRICWIPKISSVCSFKAS